MRKAVLQRLRRHQRVVAVLVAGQRRAVDEQRLRIGALHFHRPLTIRLSIGSVTLCDWSSM